MITWTRTVATTGEKFAGALKFAHEIAEYTKSKTGVDTKVEIPYGGPAMRIRWVAQYQSLAALEQTDAKLMSDPKYMEYVARATGHLTPGSAVDEIWRSA